MIFTSFPPQNAAYLIIRGMKTLHLRIKQQNSTGLRMAKILEAHPKVSLALIFTTPKLLVENQITTHCAATTIRSILKHYSIIPAPPFCCLPFALITLVSL
jgi:O-acetylhomoserine/O-acetylserine sulfhydrylase-like pyridoxal-dependent enzyme